MARQEPFEIDVRSGVVAGVLQAPERDAPWPAVLVAGGLPGSTADVPRLEDDLGAACRAAGLAVAVYGPREGEDAAVDGFGALVDDAATVFRWMLLHDDIDSRRVGVFGQGLGAIIVAGLAARTDQLNRVCLLAPVTNEDALGRLARTNGIAPLLDPDRTPEPLLASLTGLTPAADLAVHAGETLILHGAADRIVPPTCAAPYLDALEHAGRPVAHELIALADHDLSDAEARSVCLDRIEGFFATMPRAAST